ncbi:hypothetical protein PENSPDRAFT_320869 [Peniophora sp. CONT]|nr:hypothetical protein PENSPDRAFT_320869 [Peniophora sp. CONT]
MTLNGALSPPAPNPVIDPALMQPQPQQPQPQPQQTQQQYHHTPTPPTQYTNGYSYSINPAALQPSQPQPNQQLYHAQLQQQQQAQLGLRQSALHSPVQYTSNPQQQQQQQQQQQGVAPRAINPAAFYATPTPPASHASPPAQTPPVSVPMTSSGPSDTKKAAFIEKLGPLLSPRSFGGAQSVRALVSAITEFGLADVEPPTRLEVVNKILAGAGNNYYRAWMENAGAMDIVRDWLRAAAKSGAEDDLEATIMPLLTLLDRLPIEKAETLRSSKIGGLVRRLHKTKPHDIAAVRDLAQNIERKWIDKLGINKEDNDDAPTVPAVEGKKRKTPPAAAVPPAGPPAKKAALATTKGTASVSTSKPTSSASASSSKAIPTAGPSTASSSRTTVRAIPSTVKSTDSKSGAKGDSSFFSAPKPKKALPSFKKAPPPSTATGEVAKPKQGNAFEEALAAMRGGSSVGGGAGREGSAPVGERSASAGVEDVKVIIGKRKRKSVSWAPEGRLEMVRFIERAVYDDDGEVAPVGSACLRDIEKGEGAALHHALGPPFEELVDWSEPSPVELPPDLHATHATRGASSSEVNVQTAREASALRAMYLSPADVPESPGEPGVVISKYRPRVPHDAARSRNRSFDARLYSISRSSIRRRTRTGTSPSPTIIRATTSSRNIRRRTSLVPLRRTSPHRFIIIVWTTDWCRTRTHDARFESHGVVGWFRR